MFGRPCILLTCAMVALFLCAGPASSAQDDRGIAGVASGAPVSGTGKRVALVIGNGAYTTVNPLPNPPKDAKAMAAMLKTCGFEVLPYTDLDLEGMDKAVKAFSEKIPGAECALFFFAGHGLQKDGLNYLVPVKREPETQGEIRSRCLDAQEVLSAMEASGARVSILILDACRNNPLPAEARAGMRGLASMNAPKGSLIAFATSPGKEASDGPGANNSPFTTSLLRHLPTPGVDVEQVLKRVTDEVLQQTKETQSPWRQSNLRGDFYFRPGAAPTATPVESPPVVTPPPPVAPALVGHLQVAVNAPEAKVIIDGKAMGKATATEALNVSNLLVGKTLVRVEAEGYEPLEKIIDIKRDAWAQEAFELAKVIVVKPEAPRPPAVISPETREPKAGEARTFEGGEFVWIPAGSFDRGDKLSASRIASTYGGEEKWYQDAPRHRVTLTKGFWMGRDEVTNGEFAAFVKATDYKTDAEMDGWGWGRKVDGKNWAWDKVNGITWRKPGWNTDPKEPVVLVSWNDADAYISWLNKNSRETYRLPTEAEWEYACRAGSSTEFFWGDDTAGGQGYLNAADETPSPEGGTWNWKFPFKDGYYFPAPVGRFKPNPWGLHDMHGNVLEWCQNWYGDYPTGAVTDPQGAASGQYRVCRGGSWDSYPGLCRSASRYYGAPFSRRAA